MAQLAVVSSPTLPFAPITEDCDAAPPEPPWLWQGYVALGSTTLLAGKPKVGKSTLAVQLLAAIQAGAPFNGRPTKAGGALLLTEERIDALVEKARKFELGPLIHRLRSDQMFGMRWEEVIDQAIDHCQANKLDLLVVDTFTELAGLSGEEENDAGAVLRVFKPLQRAAASGLALLILVHQRKGPGSQGDAVRGSSAFVGAVDIVLELERTRSGKGPRYLKALSRFSATPLKIKLATSELVEDQESDEGRDELRSRAQEEQRLYELILEGTTTVSALSEATGIPEGTVRTRLRSLEGTKIRKAGGRGVKRDPIVWASADSEFLSARVPMG